MPGTALALQAQHLTVAHAGGDGQIERAAVGQVDALLGAVYRIEEIDREAVARIAAAHTEGGAFAAWGACPAGVAEQIGE